MVCCEYEIIRYEGYVWCEIRYVIFFLTRNLPRIYGYISVVKELIIV